MIEIAVNVGMVKLDAGQDHVVGAVMNEFRALVEERGIVLVSLQDDMIAGAGAPILTRS